MALEEMVYFQIQFIWRNAKNQYYYKLGQKVLAKGIRMAKNHRGSSNAVPIMIFRSDTDEAA